MFTLMLSTLLTILVRSEPPSPQDLIDYVNTPDPAFEWHDTNYTWSNDLYSGYTLNLTSQTWLTPEDFDGPNGYVWSHQLVCIVPKLLLHRRIAGIYATGGGNPAHPPKPLDEDVLVAAVLAVESNSIVCSLFQIPNQDIKFKNDPIHKNRGEDALVGYSWLNFINHGYDKAATKYIIMLPMAKAVSAAMTTVQQWAKKTFSHNVERFLIAGASKRGWTTWLAGAADKRVAGIAPIVMDMLNFSRGVAHMPQAYGGWTFAFKDYCEANITKYIDTPQLDALASVIDPLMYKSHLTMPKLVIDATGDEFFMPDDDYYWWGDLEGDTYRLMAQNAEHSEVTGIFELLKGIHGFYDSVILDSKRPSLDWTMDKDGTITAITDTQPDQIFLWHANSTTVNQHPGNERRDFRLVVGITPTNPCKFIPVDIFGHNCLNPVIWKSEELTSHQVGDMWQVEGHREQPSTGWVGYFIQFKFPGPVKSEFIFTTQMSIMPNTLPFGSCHDYPGGCGNCSAYLV